jgi:hypothetical protein
MFIVGVLTFFLCLFFSFFDKLQEIANVQYVPSVQDFIVADELNLPEISQISSSVSPTLVCPPEYDFTASLHIDILILICNFLPLSSILLLPQINKSLHSAMTPDSFWEKLTSLRCGVMLRHVEGQWKSSFLSLHKKRNCTPQILEFSQHNMPWRFVFCVVLH